MNATAARSYPVLPHVILCGFIIACFVRSHAQISPGDLTTSHAHLEGIANCTKCHVLGDKVTNAKCLECHAEISTRMDQRKGYHNSAEVRGKDCFTCHSEHHGRDFDIVRFDTKSFDHELTGYALTGAHRQVDCRSCHMPDHIESPSLRKNADTYLGLSTACQSCHTDVHQNTLGSQCVSCHTTQSFVPASGFDHAATDFPLKGRHREVDCKSCHIQTITNGKLMRQYANVRHEQCSTCHEDPHTGSFGPRCTDCHNENSFHLIGGSSEFNHSVTGFPLTGKHRHLDCRKCHATESASDTGNAFSDFAGKNVQQCQTCHDDVHETKFGTDCRACHTEETFRRLQNPQDFNHTLTGYPLIGRHLQVDCRECHDTRMMDPVAHQQCMDCHDDYHEGQFSTAGIITDCRSCHIETGFDDVIFTIEQHHQTNFPLVGAHEATPCISCHLQEEKWNFSDIGMVCVDCHDDVHAGLLDARFYPDKKCDQCHSPDSWTRIHFDHGVTKFELAGRHATVSCRNCHQEEQDAPIRFILQKTQCNACHEDIHGGQFMANDRTQCASCHDPTAWAPSTFDHTTARFKLDGAHAKVKCDACHQPVSQSGETYTLFRNNKLECVDCHL